jgi:cell division protein FtsL
VKPKKLKIVSSTSRKKTRSQKVVRALAVVLGTCVMLFCAYMVLAKATRPYLISYAESKEITDAKQQIAQAKAEHERLQRDIEYMKTPSGQEEEARKLGWVKQGEISVVVETPVAPTEEVRVPDTAPAPAPAKPFWQSAGDKIKHVFAR